MIFFINKNDIKKIDRIYFISILRTISNCCNDSQFYIFTGETIDVQVEITAHHMGYFDFKVCPNEDFQHDKGQDCFDRQELFLLC